MLLLKNKFGFLYFKTIKSLIEAKIEKKNNVHFWELLKKLEKSVLVRQEMSACTRGLLGGSRGCFHGEIPMLAIMKLQLREC